VEYVTVAEAYRDLEQTSGRLALVDRLAALLAVVPAGLLPTVCYLCQGLIAPEFASAWPRSSPSARSPPPPAPAPSK
jgi:DNA ligase 1